jgi:beta-galactosidase
MDRISNFLCCLIFLISFLFTKELKAQKTFNHVFNPMHGFVNNAEKPFRDELCLNGKWQFMPVFETDIRKFAKPETFTWEPVPLKGPSPWNVNSFSQGDGGDFVAFPSYPKNWEKAQMGWMKKDFVLPENWSGKQIKLHFEAIAGFAKIYVNGQLAGENLDIFFPTELDVTKLLKPGNNEILVGVAKASLTDVPGKYGRRNYVAGSFWGQHIAGIWQDVSLIAVPQLAVSDVFVQPDVRSDQLNFAFTVKNNSPETRTFSLQVSVRRWEKPATTDINLASADNGELKEEALRIDDPAKLELKSGDSLTMTLSTKVVGKLKNWNPDSPNLYGAIISLSAGKKLVFDTKYTRFGWRQFLIKGTELQLNGKPILLKGDSWHFMGIPQMTRRYAWAWFTMLKEANANAVRLHAQPYPSFYLDVADEMGICVLDETGIWSSDGGPKMDSDDYWVYCKKHVKNLVLRDRNHPSVFGWSVCNETLPVVINVFHAPETIVQRQIDEINNWVKIVKELDQTRDWISGDGEDMRPTNLPTVIGHYGNEGSMKKWSSEGKPWGVGETGMGYYGTPKQISAVNGNRAYESQQGRMEGLATEAYDLIGKQQKYDATYTSVFNIVWYGLKPLEFGLEDTTRASKPEDGIFFPPFQEGIPGVQPERLGPYVSTMNPGYDNSLPLYKPWPLFYAIQAINSTPVKPFKIENKEAPVAAQPAANISEVGIISGENSTLKTRLSEMGVPFVEAVSGQKIALIIVDGSSPVADQSSKQLVGECLKNGGKVLVWGVSPESLEKLNQLLTYQMELTERKATSFIKKQSDLIIGSLNNKDFYFSELVKQPVMKYGLSGEIAKSGDVILEACNTDWNRWNGHGENVKTAAVVRSEREAKPEGKALIKLQIGSGQLYVCSIDLLLLKSEGEELYKILMQNLGVVLKNVPVNSRKALSPEGNLEQAILIRTNENQAEEIGKLNNQQFKAKYESVGQPVLFRTNVQGIFDLTKVSASEVFLSFWVFSPRSMVNLLVEPDMPKLDMTIEGRQDKYVYVNGTLFAKEGVSGKEKLENLPLEKGWNHILVGLGHEPELRRWQTRISLQCNKEDYLRQVKSSVGQ